jgi:hypothetical protein
LSITDKDTFTYFSEDVGLKKYFPDFDFPNDVKYFLQNLLDNCEGFRANRSVSCEDDCPGLLNRAPILRTKHIKYQINRLGKSN